jgi:Uma2 family endonuclease
MAIQHLPPVYPSAVTVWIPNEMEGQILGGTQTHISAAQETSLPLVLYARRTGLDWLVRQEGELRYQRAVYTRPRDRIGQLYPDCLVAVGVPDPVDAPYDLPHIGIPPVLVIEIISKKTRRKDISTKVQAYAQMGILEYVTFDPRPRKKLELRGYRLAAPGQYQAIPLAPEGGLWLVGVGLRVVGERSSAWWQGNRLRFYSRAGERLLYSEEEADRRMTAEQERDAATQATEAERDRRLQAERGEHGERERRLQAEARAASMADLLARHGIASEEELP